MKRALAPLPGLSSSRIACQLPGQHEQRKKNRHVSDTRPPIPHSQRAVDSIAALSGAKEIQTETDEAVHSGAARASGVPSETSSSPSSASLSGAEEDAFQDQLDGSGALAPPAGVGVGQPRLREAWEDAARDLAAWNRRGGAPRALLVVSVGSVALAALTGLIVVVVFVAAAATNAVVFSVVVSMTAAGGFLAVLLAFLAALYVGALSVAVLVIAATTIATVIAITIATGWAAFVWVVWFAARECLNLTAKRWTGAANSMI